MRAARPGVVVSVLLLALVAGLAWYFGRPGAGGSEAAARPDAPAARPGPADEDEPADLADASGEGRTAVEGTATSGHEQAGPRAGAAEGALARVTGRCVDAFGAPLADVTVVTQRRKETATTDAAGRFALAIDLGRRSEGSRRLRFSRADRASVEERVDLIAGAEVTVGDVVLVGGGGIQGYVVDASGVPVPRAQVSVQDAAARAESTRISGPYAPLLAQDITDADGNFAFEGLPARELVVWAGGDDSLWAVSEPIRLDPGSVRTDVRLTLEPLPAENLLRIRVVDPEGEPVPNADIHYAYRTSGRSGTGNSSTDEEGRWSRRLDVSALHDVLAADEEGRWRPAFAADLAPGFEEHELQLTEPRTLTVRVFDTGGEAIPTPNVSARLVDTRVGGLGTSSASEEAEPGVISMQLPPAPFKLHVEAPGFEATEAGPFQPVDRQIDVQLSSLPGMRGRVTFEGEPVAGAQVGLHQAVGDQVRYEVNGFPCRTERNSHDTATTDAEGAFRLTLREAGDWYLRAEADGYAPVEIGPFALEPARASEGLDLELVRGGAIEGRVVAPPGRSATEYFVGLSRGDGFGFTVRPEPDGSYRAEGLTPGPWQVVPRDEELRPGFTSSSSSHGAEPFELEFDCFVVDGETTHFDVNLLRMPRATVTGTLLFGGQAPQGWRVSLEPLEDPTVTDTSAAVGADGSFTVSTRALGRARILFTGNQGAHACLLQTELELVDGDNPLALDLPTGEVRLRLRPEELSDEGSLSLIWTGADDLTFHASLVSGLAEELELPQVPAGDVIVSFATEDGRQQKTGTLEPGGSLLIDVP